ncbi:MAG: response regulator transcription factor [candidate division WOR-3 bacterium]|nr:MAG: response regulator transcription factor [candidate division WOR-3 bacterium]
MLADDHTLIRQGLKRIVEEDEKVEVVAETGDGLQILPKIRKHSPDMLILDISLPHLRGIEAISKIRKVNKKIKILVLTMHKNEDYVYECLSSGAQGYVLKEDAESELHTAIDSLKNDGYYISHSFSNEVIRNLVRRQGSKYRESVFDILTGREREILKLIAEGKSNKRIAQLLSLSTRTVEHHRLRIMKKLRISKVADLVIFAIRQGLVDMS